MNPFLEVAIAAARDAGAILKSDFSRPKQISYKGDIDIVTESDKRAEAVIVARLREKFPDHAIVAEEGSTGAAAGARFCWYIDPLDGTTNFAHGYPCFAVSIGLLEEGEPLVAAVFNPIADEFFTAARGEGAYLNDQRIHVSKVDKLAESLVCTGFPPYHRSANLNMNYYWEFTQRSHGVRRDGSAAMDMCSVACGRFEVFWEFGLRSWDTAAGTLLVTEAGGRVTDIAGRVYKPGGPEMFASNGLVHAEVQLIAAEIAARVAADKLADPRPQQK